MNAAPGRSILNHYIGQNIWERTNLFYEGKEIKKNLFLCKKDTPPDKYELLQLFKENKISIPKTTIKLIKSFDSFQVFEWDVVLSRIASGKTNSDYENQAAGLKSGSAETYAIKKPRAVGHSSLLIKNPASPIISINLPFILDVDLGTSEGFVLNLFLKWPMQKTFFRTRLVDVDASKTPSAYLNPYLNPSHSYYESRFGGDKWEIVFLLTSIGKGKRMLQESIQTREKMTNIDGVQSYIIGSGN